MVLTGCQRKRDRRQYARCNQEVSFYYKRTNNFKPYRCHVSRPQRSSLD